MKRCQLLIIPRMHHVTVSPRQTGWWDLVWCTLVTCLSQKPAFQIHSEQGPSPSVKGMSVPKVENCSILQILSGWSFSIKLVHLFIQKNIYFVQNVFINHTFNNINIISRQNILYVASFYIHLSDLKKHAINCNTPQTITQVSRADKEWLIFK